MNEIAKTDTKRFIGNPINCYLLLKQLTVDIDLLVSKVIDNAQTEKSINRLKFKSNLGI